MTKKSEISDVLSSLSKDDEKPEDTLMRLVGLAQAEGAAQSNIKKMEALFSESGLNFKSPNPTERVKALLHTVLRLNNHASFPIDTIEGFSAFLSNLRTSALGHKEENGTLLIALAAIQLYFNNVFLIPAQKTIPSQNSHSH